MNGTFLPFGGDALIRRKGIDGVGLITDCTELAGVSTDEWQAQAVYVPELEAYRLETAKYVKDGAMYLDVGEPTERLAGANITLMEGLRNIINWGYSLEAALTMATLTPARNFGIAGRIGTIARGNAADIVILDENMNVRDVILRGKLQKK